MHFSQNDLLTKLTLKLTCPFLGGETRHESTVLTTIVIYRLQKWRTTQVRGDFSGLLISLPSFLGRFYSPREMPCCGNALTAVPIHKTRTQALRKLNTSIKMSSKSNGPV